MKYMTDEMIEQFGKTYKIALIATIDEQGEPHISFITTLMAKGQAELTSGEFIGGLSKKFAEERKKTGFLVMSLGKQWWNGRAEWTGKRINGKEFEKYNEIPMFRYNTYFGIHTVHYYDLVDVSPKHDLKMGGIVANAIANLLVKGTFKKSDDPEALTAWAYKMMKGIGTLKFISYIDEEGYPVVYPIVQAQACDRGKIVIPVNPYAEDIMKIPEGAKVAVMGMNLDMEDVLVKGTYSGIHKTMLGKMAYVDIERVYNSLPPKHGYIYPVMSDGL
ncbi:MAG: hypothetical protein AB1Z23_13130 [Eubacteriales bacterium]